MSARRHPRMLPLLALILTACGGSTPATPTPTPTPTPAPTPTPVPSPTPPAGCTPGGDCSTNQSPVARASVRIYLAWDNQGTQLAETPDPKHQELEDPVPVGYSFLFDITGRDANDIETQGPGGDGHGIVWMPSDESTMEFVGSRSPWQNRYAARRPGRFTMCAKFDSVFTNCIGFTVVPCDAQAPRPYTCK